MPNTICAGIDIGLESNVASFIDHDGNDLTRKPLRFDNNLDGLEAFLNTLSEISTKVPCELSSRSRGVLLKVCVSYYAPWSRGRCSRISLWPIRSG